ncbi:hypothetical protein [Deinococcus apachensis]|uniref:hypothetical protein n=1 Tax=Deinococcus apachensis TaxID=309886 RepID=UPI0012F9404D|nr:hypothetical protein [Deinococcus apachensis]
MFRTVLSTILRNLLLSLAAAALAVMASSALTVTLDVIHGSADFLILAPVLAWTLGTARFTLGLPATLLFGILVAPLITLLGRTSMLGGFLMGGVGGGVLLLLTTDHPGALLGTLGGLTFAALDRWIRPPPDP